MSSFRLTVLGSSSALPTVNKYPSCHLLDVHEQFYLIDAGEGAQMQLKRYGVNPMKINHIFISHLHGDHVYGLFGLLSTMGLLGRERALEIYGPAPLREMLEAHHRFFDRHLPYERVIHEIDPQKTECIYENKVMTVETIPLKHSVPAVGYLFREKRPELNIKPFAIERYDLSIAQRVAAKRGEDITLADGERVPNEKITYLPYRPRSFAYCCDTAFRPAIAEQAEGVNLLYHEATFLEQEAALAKKCGHSTARQAAEIAKLAGAEKLILGHYSTRYKGELELFLSEAKAVFENCTLAKEGESYSVDAEVKKG